MEHYFVNHCSPTLAGLKTASLFSCPIDSESELNTYLSKVNGYLNYKDVFVEVMRVKRNRALILVYRKNMLKSELLNKSISDFLTLCGYNCSSVPKCIDYLKERFSGNDDFPHEIGVFLGYPLEDVIGFIENAGKNSRRSGCWKVYGNDCKAIKLFERYKKCREIYMKLFSNGKSIVQLTVAA